MSSLSRASLALSLLLLSCGGTMAEDVTTAPCPTASGPTVATAPTGTTAPTAPTTTGSSTSDEGMWLLNDFPSDRVQRKYGFAPDAKWLDHVRLSSVRLAHGCSGSIVSANGLVMTNHHCAEECLQQLSSKQKDLVSSSFYAKTEKDEPKCPDMEIDELVEMKDVTADVMAATKNLSDRAYSEAQRGVMSKLEKDCTTGDDVRCDVVNLYHGGKYHLYKYRRFQEVHLVFAPEQSIAFFGGDPDNFNFPRYDLDVTFLRIYDKGKPLAAKDYFAWSKAGVKEGDLTFVSGHPGGTSRLLTIAQLEYRRDVRLPEMIERLAEVRGELTQYAGRGAEQKRTALPDIFYIENALKGIKGREKALVDPVFFGQKVAAERALRAKVAGDATLAATAAGAWDAIAKAEDDLRRVHARMDWVEKGDFMQSKLFDSARTIVRGTQELTKPNEQRFREFADSRLPAVKQQLFASTPIPTELEILKLTSMLTHLREVLGADDPFVKKLLAQRSPAEIAAEAVNGTKLADPKARKALFEGGKAAVEASKDPMLALAKAWDPEARAVRQEFEDKVESVEKKQGELIAKAQFAMYGSSVYPDATFTLRLAYGSVKGWTEENGKQVAPLTTLAGAFDRATGRNPFALPKTWLDAKGKLDLQTPFNFASTNDIIGGNSGSPVINKDAEIVGIIFDGNIHSLGGDYGFDEVKNRAVSLHSAAIVETLGKVYGADRLLAEIKR